MGFLLGIAINLVIWLRSRRSSFVAIHAEQAGTYQLIVLLINIMIVVLWIGIVVGFFAGWDYTINGVSLGWLFTRFWISMLPIQIVWFFGTILYGLFGGLMVAVGRDFSYPFLGRWARERAAVKRR